MPQPLKSYFLSMGESCGHQRGCGLILGAGLAVASFIFAGSCTLMQSGVCVVSPNLLSGL
jgi:hypothetical protein